jgi:uncharacterized protein (DUF433 family)
MNAFQQAKSLIPQMSQIEKIQLGQAAVGASKDNFFGIEKTAGVCGGNACVIRTRITVRTIVIYKKLGLSDGDLLESFPTLRAQDLISVWNYYLTHLDEIEAEILENEHA